jgi:excisionase family DNA binding protein
MAAMRQSLAVSPDEAAALANVCRVTIYKWMADGLLPSRKLGKRRLIAVADLERLVTGGVQSSAAHLAQAEFSIKNSGL